MGWSVKDACSHWGIRYETYNRQCNDSKFHNRLRCMCKGLDYSGPCHDDMEIMKMAATLYNDFMEAKNENAKKL